MASVAVGSPQSCLALKTNYKDKGKKTKPQAPQGSVQGHKKQKIKQFPPLNLLQVACHLFQAGCNMVKLGIMKKENIAGDIGSLGIF